MHFAWVETLNWARFRGRQRVELGPGAFAVTAEWEHDPQQRSNWAGKSTWIAALFFLLTGKTRKTGDPDVYAYSDDVITEGEDELEVKGVLRHCGQPVLKIVRTKRRGHSATVIAARPGEPPAQQAAAERLIASVVGLEPDDLFATWFVLQKKIDRFVTALPSQRAKIAADWLPDLDRIAAAEKSIDLAGAMKELQDAEVRRRYMTERLDEHAADRLATAETDLQNANKEVAAAVIRETEARDRLSAWKQTEADRSAALQLQRDHAEATKEAERLELEFSVLGQPDENASEAEQKAGQRLALARQQHEQACKVARGEFDGTCPVNGGACPVRDEINRSTTAARIRAADFGKDRQQAQSDYDLAVTHSKETRELTAERARLKRDAVRERERAAKLAATIKERWKDGVLPPRGGSEHAATLEAEYQEATTELEQLREKQTEASGEYQAAKAAVQAQTELRRDIETADTQIRGMKQTVIAKRTARLILSRAGIQGDYARARLGVIERLANHAFAVGGVDNRIELRWGRETRELADSCAACGYPYPKRRAVKECERCGDARGPKVSPELDLVVQNRSGAGDDWAGLMVQIGASAYLSKLRGSMWASFIADEPHGSMDAAHRDIAWRLLVALADGELGVAVEQAIVISHSPDAVARMPRRILIRAAADRSTVEVL